MAHQGIVDRFLGDWSEPRRSLRMNRKGVSAAVLSTSITACMDFSESSSASSLECDWPPWQSHAKISGTMSDDQNFILCSARDHGQQELVSKIIYPYPSSHGWCLGEAFDIRSIEGIASPRAAHRLIGTGPLSREGRLSQNCTVALRKPARCA